MLYLQLFWEFFKTGIFSIFYQFCNTLTQHIFILSFLYDFILQNKLFSVQIPVFSWCHFVAFPENPVKSPLTFKSCIHGNVRNAFVSTL